MIINFIYAYIVITGACSAIIILTDKYYWSENAKLTYFIIGFLCGWILIPIKFLLGLKEIIESKIRK